MIYSVLISSSLLPPKMGVILLLIRKSVAAGRWSSESVLLQGQSLCGPSIRSESVLPIPTHSHDPHMPSALLLIWISNLDLIIRKKQHHVATLEVRRSPLALDQTPV